MCGKYMEPEDCAEPARNLGGIKVMNIAFYETLKEVEQAIAGKTPCEYVLSSLAFDTGNLKPDEDRARPEHRSLYAVGTEVDAADDAEEILRRHLTRYICDHSREGPIYLSRNRRQMADGYGFLYREPAIPLVQLFIDGLEKSHDRPQCVMARHPLEVSPGAQNIALAHCLYHTTSWTPTAGGPGPKAQVTRVSWTDLDGEEGSMSLLPPANDEEFPPHGEQYPPHRVRKLAIHARIGDDELSYISPFFISPNHGLTTTDPCAVTQEHLSELLRAAYAQPNGGLREPKSWETALVTSLAHTTTRAKALEIYATYIQHNYLDRHIAIIEEQGTGEMPALMAIPIRNQPVGKAQRASETGRSNE